MVIGIAVTLDAKGAVTGIKDISTGLDKLGQSSDRAAPKVSMVDRLINGLTEGVGQALGQRLFAFLESVPALFLSAAVATIGYSDQLAALEAKTGLAAAAQQKLALAAELGNTSLEAVASGVTKLQKNLIETPAAFERLGLSVSALRSMAPEEQLAAVGERLQAIPDPAERSAAAMAVFGKSGVEMLPVLLQNLKATNEEATRLGLVMSDDVVAAGADMDDALAKLQMTLGGLQHNIGAVFVTSEPLHVFIEGLTELFGMLSVAVQDNAGSLRSFVDGGVVFVAEALARTVGLLAYVVDAWSGLKIIVYTVQGAIEVLAGKFLILTDVLTGNLSASEAFRASKQLEADVLERTNKAVDEELARNGQRQAVVAKVTAAFQGLADRVADAAGKEHKAAGATAAHGAAHYVAADAANKHAAAVQKLAELLAGIEREGAELKLRGLGELDAELGRIELHLEELRKKIPEALSAPEAAHARAEIEGLGDGLRDAAVDAQRLRLLGDTFNDVAVQAANLVQVYQNAGVALDQLTTESLGALEKSIETLIARSPELEGTLLPLLEKTRAALKERGVLSDQEHRTLALENAMRDALLAQQQEALVRQRQMNAEALSFNGILGGALAILSHMGGELGALGEGLRDGFGSIDDLMNAESLAGVADALAGVAQGFLRVTDSASAKMRALGGAAMGAKLGHEFGGAWGAAIGAAVGAVAGIFRKPGWVKAGEAAGRVLGFAVSKELAKEIEKTAKELKLDFRDATLLNLDKAIEESGKGAGSFVPQMKELIDLIAKGGPAAAAGMKTLDAVFQDLVDDAKKAKFASLDLFAVMQQARQTGVFSESMRAFLSDTVESWGESAKKAFGTLGDVLTDAGEKVQGAVGGLMILKPEDAVNQATIFGLVWGQTVAEKGLTEAARILGPGFEALQSRLAQHSEQFLEAASAIFAPIAQQFSLATNEMFAGASDAAAGFGEILRGAIETAMPLTMAQFRAFEGTAVSAFEQAKQAGIDMGLSVEDAQTQALLAIAPLLQQLVQASEAYGFNLDENTQALIEQAQAAGVAFAASPIDRAANAMERVAEILEQVYGFAKGTADELGRAGANAGGIRIPAPPGGASIGGPAGPPPNIPELATGGIVRSRTLAYIGERGTEAVLTLPQLYGEMAAVVASRTASYVYALLDTPASSSGAVSALDLMSTPTHTAGVSPGVRTDTQQGVSGGAQGEGLEQLIAEVIALRRAVEEQQVVIRNVFQVGDQVFAERMATLKRRGGIQ